MVASTTTQPDGLAAFVDSSGTWHIVCWHGGNIYRITTAGVVSTIGSSVYASGNRIAHTDYSNDLYWSDGTTIWTSGPNSSGLRTFDGTTDAMVVSSGAGGSIEPPAAKVMATYAGQIVLGNCKLVGALLSHISSARATSTIQPLSYRAWRKISPLVWAERLTPSSRSQYLPKDWT